MLPDVGLAPNRAHTMRSYRADKAIPVYMCPFQCTLSSSVCRPPDALTHSITAKQADYYIIIFTGFLVAVQRSLHLILIKLS